MNEIQTLSRVNKPIAARHKAARQSQTRILSVLPEKTGRCNSEKKNIGREKTSATRAQRFVSSCKVTEKMNTAPKNRKRWNPSSAAEPSGKNACLHRTSSQWKGLSSVRETKLIQPLLFLGVLLVGERWI